MMFITVFIHNVHCESKNWATFIFDSQCIPSLVERARQLLQPFRKVFVWEQMENGKNVKNFHYLFFTNLSPWITNLFCVLQKIFSTLSTSPLNNRSFSRWAWLADNEFIYSYHEVEVKRRLFIKRDKQRYLRNENSIFISIILLSFHGE